jgi:hypothetical protein
MTGAVGEVGRVGGDPGDAIGVCPTGVTGSTGGIGEIDEEGPVCDPGDAIGVCPTGVTGSTGEVDEVDEEWPVCDPGDAVGVCPTGVTDGTSGVSPVGVTGVTGVTGGGTGGVSVGVTNCTSGTGRVDAPAAPISALCAACPVSPASVGTVRSMCRSWGPPRSRASTTTPVSPDAPITGRRRRVATRPPGRVTWSRVRWGEAMSSSAFSRRTARSTRPRVSAPWPYGPRVRAGPSGWRGHGSEGGAARRYAASRARSRSVACSSRRASMSWAVSRTSRSMAGSPSSRRQVRSRMASIRPLSGSRTGAPAQANGERQSAKCSRPRTYTGPRSARAVPTPLVPAAASEAQKPGAKFTSSRRLRSRRSPPCRWTTRAWPSQSTMVMLTLEREAVSRESTGSAAWRKGSSRVRSGS